MKKVATVLNFKGWSILTEKYKAINSREQRSESLKPSAFLRQVQKCKLKYKAIGGLRDNNRE